MRNASSRGASMPEVQNRLSDSCQQRRNWKDHLGIEVVGGPLDVRFSATISKIPAHRE